MAFADPSVVTINSVAKNLVRIRQDGYSSEYLLTEATQEFRFNVRNTTYTDKKRGGTVINRHNVELINNVFPVAPATIGIRRKAYFVVENQQGDTLTDPVNVCLGLLAFLSSSSGANITKMLNSES